MGAGRLGVRRAAVALFNSYRSCSGLDERSCRSFYSLERYLYIIILLNSIQDYFDDIVCGDRRLSPPPSRYHMRCTLHICGAGVSCLRSDPRSMFYWPSQESATRIVADPARKADAGEPSEISAPRRGRLAFAIRTTASQARAVRRRAYIDLVTTYISRPYWLQTSLE